MARLEYRYEPHSPNADAAGRRYHLVYSDAERKELRAAIDAGMVLFVISMPFVMIAGLIYQNWTIIYYAVGTIFWLVLAYFFFKFAFRLLTWPFRMVRRMVRGY